MNANPKIHRKCHGHLLPDFEHLQQNGVTHGKAFQVFVQQMGIGTQSREVTLKQEAWDECVSCHDFQSCYALSMAKLALHRALATC